MEHRERPIIFSAPMIRAILSGKKTQTRRMVKLRDAQFGGPASAYSLNDPADWGYADSDGYWHTLARPDAIPENERYITSSIPCPYGKLGDRLWVRETWQPLWATAERPPRGFKSAEGWAIGYPATDGIQEYMTDDGLSAACRPSIFMPRWASRLTLEIAGVRVERLQDISEEDARAEGAAPEFEMDIAEFVHGRGTPDATHYLGFKHLWKSINGAESWQANPWVWALEFKVVQQ